MLIMTRPRIQQCINQWNKLRYAYKYSERRAAFIEYLLTRGFEQIGHGSSALVFAYPNSRWVVKISWTRNMRIGHFPRDRKAWKYFLAPIWHSYSYNVTIQPRAKTENKLEAYLEIKADFETNKVREKDCKDRNCGYLHGRPVLFDCSHYQ
jgi:hypothetical protein